jgi:hypothetical protein
MLVVALAQTWCVWKYGAKWMLSMVIGAYSMRLALIFSVVCSLIRIAFAFGIGTRFGLHIHPESKGLYIVEYLFVVLSVCPFLWLPFSHNSPSSIFSHVHLSLQITFFSAVSLDI